MIGNIKDKVLKFQKNEITEFNIHTTLSKRAKGKNVDILKCIVEDKLNHEKLIYNIVEKEQLGYISSIVLGLNDPLLKLYGPLQT